MQHEHENSQSPIEITTEENNVEKATREAVQLVKQHGFGRMLPFIVAGSNVLINWHEVIDCWEPPT